MTEDDLMEVTKIKTDGKPKEKQNSEKDCLKETTNPVTFDDFDKLNLKTFGENLFEIMEKGTSSPLTEGAYTISLNAEFGNGKTTFLKMFEDFVKKEKNENYDVLFINAWESDFSKEPVIAILSEFMNWIEKNGNNKDNSEKAINKDKILRVLGNIGNQVVKSKIGFDPKKTIKSFCEKDKKLVLGRIYSKRF